MGAGVSVIPFSGHRLSIQPCPRVIPDTVHLFLHVRVTFVGTLSILWIFAPEKQPFASAFFSIVFLFFQVHYLLLPPHPGLLCSPCRPGGGARASALSAGTLGAAGPLLSADLI